MAATPLGSKIYELRKEERLTQTMLGHMVGVSGGAISQFESGASVPSASTLSKLSEVLSYDLSEIWRQAPEPPRVEEDFIFLEFIPISAHTWFESFDDSIEAIYDFTPSKVPVLRLPDVDYDYSCVIEIKGNSMSPRYPHGARYVTLPVADDLKYLTGVHLFGFNTKSTFIRRIISNKGGVLTLRADATGEESTLEIAEIEELMRKQAFRMLKLGQAVHMPPEE